MKFKDFLNSIYQRNSGNVKLGLDRINNILSEMNKPNLKLSGIHIAGTNGKGSTAAMTESLGIAHGLSTGLNTSPHLVDYNERIRINARNISDTELLETFSKWKPVFDKYEASFFEITTAIAFYLFYQKKLDLSIFEVGLGGRLDGTNPFQSTVTAITGISFDHPKSLGASIEQIAFEKAGILKEKTPLILGKLDESPKEIIKNRAIELNCSVSEFDLDYKVKNVKINTNGTTFDYEYQDYQLKELTTNLLGFHQAYNAGVGLTAFIKFMQTRQRKIEIYSIYKGLLNVKWPGRLQILQTSPTVIIDGAHNEEGIFALVENLKQLFPTKKINFVLAILRDKKLEVIIKKICCIAHKIYISKNNSTRAAEIEVQATIVKKFSDNYLMIPDINKATKIAIKEAGRDEIIIITGSLYTVSEILKNGWITKIK